MSTGIGGMQDASAILYGLYQQVYRRTGSSGSAEDAVRTAQSVLRDIYDRGIIASQGDSDYANQLVTQYTPQVMQLANLVPTIKGSDPAASGRALREAVSLLERNGLTNRSALYPWLKQHVTSDESLRAAGLDPALVRRPDSPWAHADLDALTALARDALVRYRTASGEPLSTEEIDRQLQLARQAAERLGVGTALTSATTSTGAPRPAGSVSVAAFSFPRRV